VAAKRQVDQRRHTKLRCRGQQPLFGLAVAERIVELDKIRFPAPHYRFDIVERTVAVGGDPEIADEALRFPIAQRCEVLLGRHGAVRAAVYLNKINLAEAQPL
jgi:hypothetical protein